MDKKSTKAKPNAMILNQIGPSINKLTVRLSLGPIKEDLFIEALTHSSFANEYKLPSNERLEFLGDSILSLVVCEYLFLKYPTYSEGQLSKIKAIVVSAPLLASFTKQLELDEYILLGAGEIRTSGKSKQNILADLFEAFIGAYYLNFGLVKTAEFAIPFIEKALPEIFSLSETIDAKTYLQEFAQSHGLTPEYRMVKEEGPPHAKEYTMEVLLNNQVMGSGSGKSLKQAQNKAAAAAIQKLK